MSSSPWPSLGVGIVLAVYWARVLHLARKVRRRTGHGANAIPLDASGWLMRLVWLPVVMIWSLLPFASPLLPNAPWALRPLLMGSRLAWVGFGAAVVALWLTLICWKKMGKDWRMGIDPRERTELILTGPFACVRHPIYALSSVLMLSTVAAVPCLLMVLLAVVHLTLLQIEARREETYLLRVHGSRYQQYCRQVGRFLPRWKTISGVQRRTVNVEKD